MNIYIRPLREEDALISYMWRNDPKIWKNTGSRPDRVITPEIETEWIKRGLKDDSSKRFAICIKTGNKDEYIGNIQLTNIVNDESELHIFIGGGKYWNKGIGKESNKLALKYAFYILRLERVYLRVNKRNIPAIKHCIENGFEIYNQNQNDDFISMHIHNSSINAPKPVADKHG